MSTKALMELRAAIGANNVVTEPASMEAYRRDYTLTETVGMPLAVARPESVEQVQELARWATRHRIPLVPRGAGTGLSGGSSALDGAVTVSLDRMARVDVDAASRTASVAPGALNVEVKRAAADHGLWYPPDPSSYEMCSIGGNLATNAGGLCCVKYGVTSEYVLGLDVVLADGRLLRLGGQTIKNVAGLNLIQLFVGSEGILGIIVGATLRLLPPQPPRATLAASFPSVQAAAAAVVDIGRSLRPSLLELMDSAAIAAVEAFRPMGLDLDAGALLLAQSDAAGPACSEEIEAMAEVCRRSGAEVDVTADADEAEMFLHARRVSLLAIDRLGATLAEDVGVAVPKLPELLSGIEAIARRRSVLIPVVAHAGDGNTHPKVVFDAGSPASRESAQCAFNEIMALAIELGGTITGEHGVGRLKRAALPEQLGPDVMDVTRSLKAAVDPLNLMNPGAIL